MQSMSFWRGLALTALILFLGSVFFDFDASFKFSRPNPASFADGSTSSEVEPSVKGSSIDAYIAAVLPADGVTLPIKWKDIGKQLVDTGVIDSGAFESLSAQRGGLSEYERELLYGSDNLSVRIDEQNAPFLLNLLWAFGIGNKNPVLEQGPINDQQYGGAGGFASTGGWTLSVGDAMSHFSKHEFVVLTAEQQKLVERVSQNIYRPCCGNSTYFPDCNHGMAMLGLLELLAAAGVNETEMYQAALAVNAYWFPDTYLTIAKYLDAQGTSWADANALDILGYQYSSNAGFAQVKAQVEPIQKQSGGGCGV